MTLEQAMLGRLPEIADCREQCTTGMDLFDDLPPPSNDNKPDNNSSLFGDLPPPTTNVQPVETLKGRKRKLNEKLANGKEGKKSATEVKFLLKGFVAERIGERDEMQDAHVIFNDLSVEFDGDLHGCSRLAYYAVFDGHAGHRASQYAAEHLHRNIMLKFPKGDVSNQDREIKKCLLEAYKKTDEDFLQEASKSTPVLKDGSTAVSVLVMDDVLYVANLGDSKALLCRYSEDGNMSVVPLSKDHSPTQYEERIRIQKAGGSVRDGRVLGVLGVSRSFGDGRFKRCGVISSPDIVRCTLTERDRFLVLACDGLWKGFTVDGAVKFVNNIIIEADQEPKYLKKESDDTPSDRRSEIFEMACSKTASEAIRNGSSDNVTVMLVSITKQRC